MTWLKEQAKLKENYVISKIGDDNSCSSLEKSKARLKMAASKLPIAGYIDADGATVAPASWRED